MAGGIAGKGSALVVTARAAVADCLLKLDRASANGRVDGGTEHATFLAAVTDPSIAAAITALQAIQ